MSIVKEDPVGELTIYRKYERNSEQEELDPSGDILVIGELDENNSRVLIGIGNHFYNNTSPDEAIYSLDVSDLKNLVSVFNSLINRME